MCECVCGLCVRGGVIKEYIFGVKSKPLVRTVTKIDLDLHVLVIKFSFAYLFPKNPAMEV